MPDDADKSTIGDDLIWGAAAIGVELNLPTEKIYNLIRSGKIPVSKLGPKTLIASRKQLRRVLLPNS